MKRPTPARRLPSFRRRRFKEAAWGVPVGLSHKNPLAVQQQVVPADQKLGQKLGIAKSDRVLVFAGYFGDWAQALSHHAHVTYSDIGKTMTAFVKTHKPGRIERFWARPAQALPHARGQFDWSFSFEPYPLRYEGSLDMALARSLLNRKGAIIVNASSSNASNLPNRPFSNLVNVVAKIYGANARSSVLRIWTKGGTSRVLTPLGVDVLRSNMRARKRARIDLEVYKMVFNAKRRFRAISDEEICRKLNISPSELEQSRNRLTQLEDINHFS